MFVEQDVGGPVGKISFIKGDPGIIAGNLDTTFCSGNPQLIREAYLLEDRSYFMVAVIPLAQDIKPQVNLSVRE